MIHASPQHEFIGNGDNFIINWLVEKGCRALWTFSKVYRAVLRFCSQISTPNIMKIWPFSLSWMQVVKCLIVANKYESPDLGINSSLWHWSNWNLPFPTSGPSQFPQKIITLCSLSSIYYLQLPSKYLNKERSDQGEGSEIFVHYKLYHPADQEAKNHLLVNLFTCFWCFLETCLFPSTILFLNLFRFTQASEQTAFVLSAW